MLDEIQNAAENALRHGATLAQVLAAVALAVDCAALPETQRAPGQAPTAATVPAGV